jgi:general secretion pathway protein H
MRGFTLLELLVVLMLVGVLVGMVSFSGGKDLRREAQQQARLFTQQLQHARQQAVLDGREYGIRFDAQSYWLMKWTSRGWENVGSVQPTDMDLRLEIDGHALATVAFNEQPQLLIMSSDETGAFSLHFERAGLRLASVTGDGLNEPLLDE